ncbi:MAG: hypothetical protein DLM68_04095 [Hyphomicrobiales bacterium]|nr:MAG: hypothetical protein DLM68_04095 [Hyphomicrobiales bacterium]
MGNAPNRNFGGSRPVTVSVIDTASNMVVGTPIPVDAAFGIAITPDGKHAYVTSGIVDGKRAYLTNFLDSTVKVIDTATNMLVTTLTLGNGPLEPNTMGVAITPDGKHAYVTNAGLGTVAVIDTATNMMMAHGPGGGRAQGGSHHPGREARLCGESVLQQCLGDRHGQQHGGGHGRGGGPQGRWHCAAAAGVNNANILLSAQ